MIRIPSDKGESVRILGRKHRVWAISHSADMVWIVGSWRDVHATPVTNTWLEYAP
jgi:hypothetical protein